MPDTPTPDPQQQTGGFDVDAARAAGYTDDAILRHLTATRNFDVTGAVKAGYTKAQIIDHLAGTPAPHGSSGSWEAPESPIKRFGKSALEQITGAVKGVGQMLKQGPVETAIGVGKQAMGGLENAAERYGEGDPLGAIQRLAGATPMIGPTAERARQQAEEGDVAGSAGTLAGLGALTYGPAALGKVASALPEGVPGAGSVARSLARRALKPPVRAEGAELADTMIRNEIPVSAEGVAKRAALVRDLNSQVDDAIAARPGELGSIDKARANYEAVRSRYTSPKARAEIDAEWKDFEDSLPTDPKALTVEWLQNRKKELYDAVGPKAYQMGKGSPGVAAAKAIASGLRDEVGTHFPEVHDLNAAEGALIDLKQPLAAAVQRGAKLDPVGLASLVATHAGSSLLGSILAGPLGAGLGGIVGLTAGQIMRSPAMLSKLALVISKAEKIPIAEATARIPAYLAPLGVAGKATADVLPFPQPPGAALPTAVAAIPSDGSVARR